MSQSRQLAAIMFTDIVGYTALMGEDEQKAFELLKKNRSVQRPIIEKFNGRWLKEIGDGVLASFSTVSDAVYCAKEIQKTCLTEPDLNLRIGIHLGEVVFDGDDVFGDGVNIASRLEPLAPVGGILVSESVHRNLGNKKNIISTFIREEQLKNVRERIKIYSVQVESVEPLVLLESSAAPQSVSLKASYLSKIVFASLAVTVALLLVYLFYSRQSPDETSLVQPEVTDKSIAVLPFKNDSPDADNQYFADGMMDEILNHLQKVREVGVKSRTAVEPYRNSTKSFATIAQELKVSFVLEGAVRKYGDRFRVTTQLIEVESGNHLWSDTYDGIFTDTIFIVQSHIAKQIVNALDVVITPEEQQRIDKVPTKSVKAYELLIKGRHEMLTYWRTTNVENLYSARDFYNKSLILDPEYLFAIADLGATFMAELNYDSALYYAEKVIALDSESSSGYNLKAECYRFIGEFDLAIEYYSEALRMDKFSSPDHQKWSYVSLGRALEAKGDPLKALPYLAKGLDMSEEHLPNVYNAIAHFFINIGDYDRAEKYFQLSVELNPSCFSIYGYFLMFLSTDKLQNCLQVVDLYCDRLGCGGYCSYMRFYISILKNELNEAELYFSQYQSNKTFHSIHYSIYRDYEVGYVYHQQGRVEESHQIFEQGIEKLKSRLDDYNGFAFLHISRIYAFQGKRKEALKYLTEYAKRGFNDGWPDFILIDPFFEGLRDDPEFRVIVKRAQEEKAAIRTQIKEMEERGELTM